MVQRVARSWREKGGGGGRRATTARGKRPKAIFTELGRHKKGLGNEMEAP